MMTGYTPTNGNNNSLRPQFSDGYSNGVIPNQNIAQSVPRLGQPPITQAQQPRVSYWYIIYTSYWSISVSVSSLRYGIVDSSRASCVYII